MDSYKIKRFFVALIITALILSATGIFLFQRQDISQATYSDIIALEEFDEVLSYEVVLYIKNNKDATVEDLIDIKGIGEKRLRILKRKYK